MYTYYLISIVSPEYAAKVWWKKYLTQMQMVRKAKITVFAKWRILTTRNSQFTGAIFISGFTHVGFGVSTELHVSEIRHFITRSAKFIHVFVVLRFLPKSVL